MLQPWHLVNSFPWNDRTETAALRSSVAFTLSRDIRSLLIPVGHRSTSETALYPKACWTGMARVPKGAGSHAGTACQKTKRAKPGQHVARRSCNNCIDTLSAAGRTLMFCYCNSVGLQIHFQSVAALLKKRGGCMCM